jgi:hypothetical protein
VNTNGSNPPQAHVCHPRHFGWIAVTQLSIVGVIADPFQLSFKS